MKHNIYLQTEILSTKQNYFFFNFRNDKIVDNAKYTCNTNSVGIVATSCQVLTNIPGGSVIVTGNSQGDVAVYMCSQGYKIQGTNVRKCQANGQWSSTVPNCAGIVERKSNV